MWKLVDSWNEIADQKSRFPRRRECPQIKRVSGHDKLVLLAIDTTETKGKADGPSPCRRGCSLAHRHLRRDGRTFPA